MQNQKLFLFDFDGVIIDGMKEYWNSSLIACKKFLKSPKISHDLNDHKEVPEIFINLRPWVKYGWEMVLIVHEIIKEDNPLTNKNKDDFLYTYDENCQKLLLNNSWTSEDLQKCLDDSRKYQIDTNFEVWVNLHNSFGEVLDFIEETKKRNIQTGIITTKGITFTKKILNNLKIYPELIFGYEAGNKVDIAYKLSERYSIKGFIEDRRSTLIDIKNDPKTKKLECFLADWGYLKDSDRINLPKNIKLLKLRNLEDLLAI